MKKILALLAVLMSIGMFSPTTATANDCPPVRIVGHHACGKPIYAEYRVVQRDCRGIVIRRQWVTLNSNHSSCGRCNPRPYCPENHQRNAYDRGSSYQRGSSSSNLERSIFSLFR